MMNFKGFLKYYVLSESLKDIEMDKILDKISKKTELTDKEKKFLDLYNLTKDDGDFMMLSKHMALKKVKDILTKEKTIICNLTDRNGRIGERIVSLIDDIESEFSYVKLASGKNCKLHDRYLYNIIFNVMRNRYSLEEHDEYYEKIEAI